MIRTMRADDIAGAMRLKEAAGWNQTPLDWKRLLRLEPDGCFVDERDGILAGTTTALRHGNDLAWIGMVLVLPEFRRQGIARGLMKHALRWLLDSGVRVSCLDATDMGRPLYVELGYRDAAVIERWERQPVAASRSDSSRKAIASLSSAPAMLDRRACGYDRSALIRDLACDDSVEGVQSESGFAFGRPGSSAWFVGPCVAISRNGARKLLASLLKGHESDAVFWDLLPSMGSAAHLASSLGFRPVRRLVRMVLDESGAIPTAGQPDRVYASAGFEFG